MGRRCRYLVLVLSNIVLSVVVVGSDVLVEAEGWFTEEVTQRRIHVLDEFCTFNIEWSTGSGDLPLPPGVPVSRDFIICCRVVVQPYLMSFDKVSSDLQSIVVTWNDS